MCGGFLEDGGGMLRWVLTSRSLRGWDGRGLPFVVQAEAGVTSSFA